MNVPNFRYIRKLMYGTGICKNLEGDGLLEQNTGIQEYWNIIHGLLEYNAELLAWKLEDWKSSNWDTTTGLNRTSWEIKEEQLFMERKKWKMSIC